VAGRQAKRVAAISNIEGKTSNLTALKQKTILEIP